VASTQQDMEHTAHAKERRGGVPPSWVIRDDPAGTLSTGLQRQIECARQLLASAEAIESEGDSDRWREEFSSWRRRCGATLQRGFEREAAEEFYRGTRIREHPPRQWREARRTAIRAVEDMTQLLVTLRQTLSGQGAPKRRANRSTGGKTSENEASHDGCRMANPSPRASGAVHYEVLDSEAATGSDVNYQTSKS
jgi:hypothetical protein